MCVCVYPTSFLRKQNETHTVTKNTHIYALKTGRYIGPPKLSADI